MRKVDIERSRDYYKDTVKSCLHCMTNMAEAFERMEKQYRERIKVLKSKLEKK